MAYKLSLKEIYYIAKNNLKMILVFSIIIALLLGGFKFIKTMRTGDNISVVDKQTADNYAEWNKYNGLTKKNMETELVWANKLIDEHPLMKLDPDSVNYRSITFSLDERAMISRKALVNSWIGSLSCKSLFGKESEILNKYRNDLTKCSGDYGEIIIMIYDIKEYDYNKVAGIITRFLNKKFNEAGIKVTGASNQRFSGYSQYLFDQHDSLRNNVLKLQNGLVSAKNYVMDNPYENVKSDNKIMIVIYLLLGLVLGAILGLLLAIFNVVRKGTIISCEQVEDFFEASKIGETDKDSEYDVRLIDRIIKYLTSEKSVLLVGGSEEPVMKRFVSKINEISETDYEFLTDKVDNIETVAELEKSKSAVVMVHLGHTTQNNVADVHRWAERFNKSIIGYVVVK